MRIFIIDDDPFIRRLLCHQLRDLGETALYEFEDGACALGEILSKHGNDDLIFCDLHMPGTDGVELVRELGHMKYQGGLVLISGEDVSILQTVEKLALDYRLRLLGAIQKPVSLQQLQSMLALMFNSITAPPVLATSSPYSAAELRQALRQGELINHYQPKVNISTAEITGVEALVRWSHPLNGLVYPDCFIGLAERHRLMDQLTFGVLRRALEDAVYWRSQGIDLQIAVNISMSNLETLDFPQRIEEELKRLQLPPTSLLLEVTESQLMRNRLAVMEVLSRLRLKRIGLSIDDFGTGHSSLAQLRDFPFNELKIDRSFVHGACRSNTLRGIFHGCLGIGRQLGLNVVAEGVEDDDDWTFLKQAGCNQAQGYFIAKPMSADALIAWYNNWPARKSKLQGSIN